LKEEHPLMKTPEVSAVSHQERKQALAAVMLGFATDPFVRWFHPEPLVYMEAMEAFDAFGGGAIDAGGAYRTENFEGVALWYPPGAGPDEERLAATFTETVPGSILDEVFGVFGAMERYHPEGDCWYLPIIGVDPVHQGRGFGSSLMKTSLSHIDEQGLPAYLESSNPRNISLYLRHGFEVMGEIQVGSSPVITPMYREAR
jgi:GNAT superfamily N-acetyltransferase